MPDTCVHCVSVQVLDNNFMSLSEPELHFKNKKQKTDMQKKLISAHKNTENTKAIAN